MAEDKYSRELLAHAESIKVIEDLKQQLSTARASARDNLASAETAQAKLLASEASWVQQKDALDKEIVDLNARYALLVVLSISPPMSRISGAKIYHPRITFFISISNQLAPKQPVSDRRPIPPLPLQEMEKPLTM